MRWGVCGNNETSGWYDAADREADEVDEAAGEKLIISEILMSGPWGTGNPPRFQLPYLGHIRKGKVF